MRILGIFEVDEQRLGEAGRTFDEEMMSADRPGITLIQSAEINDTSYEYAAFVWNTRNESYEQIGRPVGTEMICRSRLQERISNGWLNNDYDTSKTKIERRTITMFAGEWEALG